MFIQSRIQLNVKTEEHFMVVHSSLFVTAYIESERERKRGRDRKKDIERKDCIFCYIKLFCGSG